MVSRIERPIWRGLQDREVLALIHSIHWSMRLPPIPFAANMLHPCWEVLFCNVKCFIQLRLKALNVRRLQCALNKNRFGLEVI